MFKANIQTRNISADASAAETTLLFEKALELIGHRSISKSNNSNIIEGGSYYGLQKISFKIEISGKSSSSAQVRVSTSFKDLSGIAAQRCTDRLINAFHIFQSGSPAEKKALSEQSKFSLKTGFSRWRIAASLLFFTTAIGCLLHFAFNLF